MKDFEFQFLNFHVLAVSIYLHPVSVYIDFTLYSSSSICNKLYLKQMHFWGVGRGEVSVGGQVSVHTVQQLWVSLHEATPFIMYD